MRKPAEQLTYQDKIRVNSPKDGPAVYAALTNTYYGQALRSPGRRPRQEIFDHRAEKLGKLLPAKYVATPAQIQKAETEILGDRDDREPATGQPTPGRTGNHPAAQSGSVTILRYERGQTILGSRQPVGKTRFGPKNNRRDGPRQTSGSQTRSDRSEKRSPTVKTLPPSSVLLIILLIDLYLINHYFHKTKKDANKLVSAAG